MGVGRRLPAMASEGRRIGCGCLLPLILIVFVVPVILAVATGLVDSAFEVAGVDLLDVAVAVFALVAVLVVVAVFRRRRREDEDTVTDRGRPTSTRSSERPRPPAAPAAEPGSPPPPYSSRGLPRGLRTEPEDEDARRLKARLSEAVSDLSQTVEEMPQRGSGPSGRHHRTSEEMIAEAKQRIRDWDRDHPRE